MVNIVRGEVEAVLDGRAYRLCLTLGALAELEADLGEESMLALAERFEGGRIRGRDEEGIRVFRGVPYARAPAGARRLRPPEPPEPWSGVREALRAADVAPQNRGAVQAMLGADSQRSSEDCLALDLWTPGLDAGRRPVLVWLHGGGFTTGSGSLGVYDGRRLARRGDAVVVTLNYRLGALGYLALPALAREEGGALGNLGLLDQVAALRWVREHVAHFGGDPENVTLFGESAGAMSAATLLATPAARGLFRRVVLQSGAARHVHDREDGLRVAETFMKELALDADDVAGLRAAPVAALLAAQERCLAALAGVVRTVAFQPVVDGEVLPRQPLAAVREGSAAAVPMLIGTNRDEWKLFGLNDRRAKTLDEAGLPAGVLPYGDRKRVELARAFVSQPVLTLLDEPVAGLNPEETAEIAGLLRQLRQQGKTMLLVEHDMELVMGVADHVVVLDSGKKIATGPPEEVRVNPLVLEAYLGRMSLTA